MLPGLLIVITISGIKDFIEDRRRKISDNEENEKICYSFNINNKSFSFKKWEDVMIGDILKVKNNEEFPADLILLSSTNENGLCYIETKNLDGETNLKIKTCEEGYFNNLAGNEENINKISGSLHAKFPNENIYEFDATIKLNKIPTNLLDEVKTKGNN